MRTTPPAAPATAGACGTSDQVGPTLTGLDLSPAALDVRTHAQTLHITGTATDDGGAGTPSGVVRFTVSIWLGAAAAAPASIELRPAGDGTWAGDLPFFPGAAPGVHAVGQVELNDRAGNLSSYSEDHLRAQGLGGTVTLKSTTLRSTPDTAPPEVSGFAASSSSVDTRSHKVRVRYSAHLADQSGIRVAFVEAGLYRAELHQVSGTASAGRWAGSLTVPRFQQQERMTHDVSIYVLDSLTVLAVRQSGTTVDRRRHDGNLVITVRAGDTGSGVSNVGLSYSSEGFSYAGRLVSGTRHSGRWQIVVPLRHCGAKAGTERKVRSVSALDALGNLTRLPHAVTYWVLSADT